MTTFGLLIFDGAEELDFVGPWEVFTASAMLQAESGTVADTCMTIAEHAGPIRCAKGLRVVADHSFSDHPPLDVLLVPGGVGARRGVSNATLTGWIGKTAAEASWVTGVCTGALLLREAGPARGRRVATHRAYEDALAARGEVTVVRDARYTGRPLARCPPRRVLFQRPPVRTPRASFPARGSPAITLWRPQ